MSNKYWGWGLEDDEFYVRLREAKLEVTRPQNILTDRTNTFRLVYWKRGADPQNYILLGMFMESIVNEIPPSVLISVK